MEPKTTNRRVSSFSRFKTAPAHSGPAWNASVESVRRDEDTLADRGGREIGFAASLVDDFGCITKQCRHGLQRGRDRGVATPAEPPPMTHGERHVARRWRPGAATTARAGACRRCAGGQSTGAGAAEKLEILRAGGNRRDIRRRRRRVRRFCRRRSEGDGRPRRGRPLRPVRRSTAVTTRGPQRSTRSGHLEIEAGAAAKGSCRPLRTSRS